MARRPLDITPEEAARLRECLGDPEFRRALAEYAASPDARADLSAAIDPSATSLAVPLTPAALSNAAQSLARAPPLAGRPGFVLKSRWGRGGRKVFVNVCSSDKVDDPQVGEGGWRVPHLVSPRREERDHAGDACDVYDAVFGPGALRLATPGSQMRSNVIQTVVEAVEADAGQQLDRNTIKGLANKQYFGTPQARVVDRSPAPVSASASASGGSRPGTASAASPPAARRPEAPQSTAEGTATEQRPRAAEGPVAPKYTVVHSGSWDIAPFYTDKALQPEDPTRPRQLVVRVELPLCSSAAGVELDIEGSVLRLSKPPLYALEAQLHYQVDADCCRAQFDKATRTLSVTVPVLPPRPREQTEQSPRAEESAEEPAEEQPQAPVAAFADTEVAASGEVPAYGYSQNEDTVTLVVRSEGCDPESLRLVLPDSLHVRVEYELRATRAAPRRRVALAWELSAPVDVARCRCTASELNVCAVLPKRQAAWWEQLGRQTAGSCEPAKAAFTNSLVYDLE
eukprot:m51a1_g1886 hypothetical protein (513) ;mRNA; f:714136-716301